MIFVISDEIIPETHRHHQQTPATGGLMIGFVVIAPLRAVCVATTPYIVKGGGIFGQRGGGGTPIR